MRQVLDSLASLFAPPVCFGCGEIGDRNVLCPICLQSFEFLEPEGRCFRCFSEICTKTCHSCRQFPLVFRRAALFEKMETSRQIYYQKHKQMDLIASLFTWQYIQLQWPLFEFVSADASLKSCAKVVAKNFGKKVYPKGEIQEGVNVLYLSSGLEDVKFPFTVCTAKIFHLSFFYF